VRVLTVNPGLNLGGAERSLLLLLPALRAQGLDVIVAGFGAGPFLERAASLGFRTVELDVDRSVRRATRYRMSLAAVGKMAWRAVPAVRRLSQLIRRERIDLVHTNGLKAHMLGACAGALARVPVVWHIRDFPVSGVAGGILKRVASRLPAAVITNSSAVARAYFAARSRPNVFVVPNPIDLATCDSPDAAARACRALGVPAGQLMVAQIAHLTPWKGHELFLDIAKRVLDRIPNVTFAVVGGAIYETDGHSGYEARLRQRASTLGIADRILFLGARDDVAKIVPAFDVVVHCPTAPEPFGRVLAEAMAAGRPVVAANDGGVPEVVDDGVTGTLVPPGDVEAFTAAVVRLLQDAELRRRFGAAGQAKAKATFGVDAHVARVLDVYETVLGTAARAR
jgi:glycosyltransferase involved in cell wall biosynthesis